MKLTFSLLACTCLLFLLCPGKGHAQTVSAADVSLVKKLIGENNQQYLAAIQKNDLSAFEAQFMEDSWIMSPGTPVYCGPNAIADYFNEVLMKNPIAGGKLTTVDIYGNGTDVVSEVGFYRFYDTSNEELDNGKYIVLWKNINGQWKRHRQSMMSSEPTERLMAEVKKQIAESNAIYFQAFVKNDPAIFTDRYSDDACIMAPFAPQQCGRENAAKFFRDAYDNYGMRNGKFITTAIYGDASGYVTEEGLWQSFNAKGEPFDDGKFLVLWKKTDKGWKMFRDSFSSNRNLK